MKECQRFGFFRSTEINKPDNIKWINSFSNEKGEIIKPPFEGIDVPREILCKIVLTEQEGRTIMVFSSEPWNASETEINTFIAICDSMVQGFGGTLNQLSEYLKRME